MSCVLPPSLALSQTKPGLNFIFATKQQAELPTACFSSAKYSTYQVMAVSWNGVIQVSDVQQTEAQQFDFTLGCFSASLHIMFSVCDILHLKKFLHCL